MKLYSKKLYVKNQNSSEPEFFLESEINDSDSSNLSLASESDLFTFLDQVTATNNYDWTLIGKQVPYFIQISNGYFMYNKCDYTEVALGEFDIPLDFKVSNVKFLSGTDMLQVIVSFTHNRSDYLQIFRFLRKNGAFYGSSSISHLFSNCPYCLRNVSDCPVLSFPNLVELVNKAIVIDPVFSAKLQSIENPDRIRMALKGVFKKIQEGAI